MVRGLDRFRDHFRDYTQSYVLIGGAACDLSMEDAGLTFRATQDLDIVLCVEALEPSFVQAFWDFVRNGGYKNRQKSTGKRLFYRFFDPQDASYPSMLELFSKQPDSLAYEGDGHLTPIPMGEEASSLSAILLDESYYTFLHAGKHEMEGLSMVGPECLIPLKARAWLDLKERREQGEHVDERNIKKHKNDVFRIFRIVDPAATVTLSPTIRADLMKFIEEVASEPVSLKDLGYQKASVESVLSEMRQFYGLVD